MFGCIRKAHREYTSKIEEWLEKLHRAADAVALGHEEAAETVSEERKWLIALRAYPSRPACLSVMSAHAT